MVLNSCSFDNSSWNLELKLDKFEFLHHEFSKKGQTTDNDN